MNTGRASLDCRVKDAEYLYQNIKSLLEDLQESLIEGFDALHFANLFGSNVSRQW